MPVFGCFPGGSEQKFCRCQQLLDAINVMKSSTPGHIHILHAAALKGKDAVVDKLLEEISSLKEQQLGSQSGSSKLEAQLQDVSRQLSEAQASSAEKATRLVSSGHPVWPTLVRRMTCGVLNEFFSKRLSPLPALRSKFQCSQSSVRILNCPVRLQNSLVTVVSF